MLQINTFPQYSEKMQLVCCRSIVKVFLALSGKGPVLWSFISTVGESVILTLLWFWGGLWFFGLDFFFRRFINWFREMCGIAIWDQK